MRLATAKDIDNLEKLLHAARGNMRAIQVDLDDIKKARVAAEASLKSFEENGPGYGLALVSGGVSDRRHKLSATIMMLSHSEEQARLRLEEANAEFEKLERLLAKQKARMAPVNSSQRVVA